MTLRAVEAAKRELVERVRRDCADDADVAETLLSIIDALRRGAAAP